MNKNLCFETLSEKQDVNGAVSPITIFQYQYMKYQSFIVYNKMGPDM